LYAQRHQLLFRLGVFYCAAPVSGAFGGLLASGLAQISYHGYDGWPWICESPFALRFYFQRTEQSGQLTRLIKVFVEGSMTVLVAFAAFWFLPNTPSTAKFLSEEDQHFAAHRLRLDLTGATSSERVDEEKFSWEAVRPAL